MKKTLLTLILTMAVSSHAFAQVERITMGGALGQDIDLNGYDITGTGDISADDISASGILLGSAGLIALGTGSASAADASTQPGTFSGGAAPTAGNIYGINIAKTGYENLLLGINKNTATGSVPASGAYISTYNATGTITIGRGNTAGAPNSADIAIAADGNVSMGGQVFSSAGGFVAPNPVTTVEEPSFTLGPEHRGMIFVSAGSDQGANTTIILSSAGGLVAGDCVVVGNAGAGVITFVSAGSETLRPAQDTTMSTQYKEASVCMRSLTEAWISGGID